VRRLDDHLKSEPEPPNLRPSSNVDFPVASITGPATDPILSQHVPQHDVGWGGGRLRPFLKNIFLEKFLEKNNFLEKFSRNSRKKIEI
jgi:hypothetical protein